MADEPKIAVPQQYLRSLESKVENLKVLIDVSSLISSTLDLNDLMPLVMEKAKNVMDAEACSILFYNRETNKLEFEIAMCDEDSKSDILKKTITLDMGQGIAGWVAENRKPLIIEDVKKDNRFFQNADKMTGFTTKGIVAVPLVGRSGLIGVAEVINPVMEEYDAEIFELLCRQFAIAIENARFYRESIEREKMKQQLEIAAALQKSFLPRSPVVTKGDFTVSAVNFSAAQVGGDIYDFSEPSEEKVGVLIGDVSGKGISAALYMAKFISDFRYVSHGLDEPDVTLSRLNTLVADAPRGMFLTAVYGVVNTRTGHLHLCVAGHPPFLWISKGEVRVMTVQSGPPLGIMPIEYPSAAIQLERGDRVILLTDGVFDAKNKAGERLSFEAVIDFVKEHKDDEQLVGNIVDFVDAFGKGTERADDLTMVEIRWNA